MFSSIVSHAHGYDGKDLMFTIVPQCLGIIASISYVLVME